MKLNLSKTSLKSEPKSRDPEQRNTQPGKPAPPPPSAYKGKVDRESIRGYDEENE